MRSNGIVREFTQRKDQEESIAETILRYGRQRVGDIATHLSRKGAAAASAEICNGRVNVLIELAYQEDETGPCNRDPLTGRLLVPVPWGRKRTVYQLRATEADILRRHMMGLARAARPVPLFLYDGDTRCWYLNQWDYPDYQRAVLYWEICSLSAKGYRNHADTLRAERGNGA